MIDVGIIAAIITGIIMFLIALPLALERPWRRNTATTSTPPVGHATGGVSHPRLSTGELLAMAGGLREARAESRFWCRAGAL